MELKNKKVLLTAGPTQEPIDPVRYISNHSSGKMGYAIAEQLKKQGAEVILVSGPTNLTPPSGIEFIQVKTAEEMYQASVASFDSCDAAILCAAVADYTPKIVANKKLKKMGDEFTIEMTKTKDIARELGGIKKENQVLVGFALETDNEVENAKGKLQSKNLDFIVLNSMQNKGTTFGVDNNQIVIIEQNKITEFELKSKELVALDIVNFLSSY